MLLRQMLIPAWRKLPRNRRILALLAAKMPWVDLIWLILRSKDNFVMLILGVLAATGRLVRLAARQFRVMDSIRLSATTDAIAGPDGRICSRAVNWALVQPPRRTIG
ncbi:MAG: hypothetical protein ACREX3_02945 [Gammaproteobacteria bacterium]